ncbi:MAG: hypothetical protein ACKO2K_12300, partial [Alphaproteobacteria bacterium]
MGEGRRFARGRGVPRDAGLANRRGRRSALVVAAVGLLALLAAAAPSARAALFSDSISVSGDSIS